MPLLFPFWPSMVFGRPIFTGPRHPGELCRRYVEEGGRAAGKDYPLGARQNIARWIHLGRDEQGIYRQTAALRLRNVGPALLDLLRRYLPKFDTQAATLQSMKDSGIFLAARWSN